MKEKNKQIQPSFDISLIIAKKELLGYFISPLAYIFIIIFLLMSGLFTFGAPPFGNFLNNNQASLSYSFFPFFPWLFLILAPPMSMRIWAEEQKSGTMELLFTMPINIFEAVFGKFLAAWAIIIISILLTFPIIVTVNWLGNPDNGTILCGYFGAILLGGAYISVGSISSALCKNQIISYIYTIVLCLILLLIGHPSLTNMFTTWAPVWFTDTISGLSIFNHFDSIQKGILNFEDITYFSSIIFFGLFSTCLIIHVKRKV